MLPSTRFDNKTNALLFYLHAEVLRSLEKAFPGRSASPGVDDAIKSALVTLALAGQRDADQLARYAQAQVAAVIEG
jgi:hypothetical protein